VSWSVWAVTYSSTAWTHVQHMLILACLHNGQSSDTLSSSVIGLVLGVVMQSGRGCTSPGGTTAPQPTGMACMPCTGSVMSTHAQHLTWTHSWRYVQRCTKQACLSFPAMHDVWKVQGKADGCLQVVRYFIAGMRISFVMCPASCTGHRS
jgi:hypothetical protein